MRIQRMNMRLALGLSVLLAVVTTAASEARVIESRIDAVTVYLGGAEVTRVADLELEAGSNLIVLQGLPAEIDRNSVRAHVESPDVSVETLNLDILEQREAHDGEVKRLEDAITEIKDRIASIDDDAAAARLQLSFLEGLTQDHAANERNRAAAGQADIDSWQHALETIGESASAAMQRVRNAGKARREAEKDLSVLERDLGDKRNQHPASVRLTLTLESASNQRTTLSLSYYQWSAIWTPSYSAYLDSRSSTLTLELSATIRQSTSEAWQDVLLTLSTASPTSTIVAPRQGSRFLDLLEDRVRGKPSPFGRAVQEPGVAVLEEAIPRVQVEQHPYSVSYRAPERASVSNNSDQARSVPLTEYRSEVALVSRTNPRQYPHAFLAARYTHEADSPLLSGNMRVFVDGAYTGAARVTQFLPGAEVFLPMGQDRQIQVTAVDQGGEKGREGLLSNRSSEYTDHLFEIVNRHSRRAQVEVVDYYPVARDERIDVTVPRSATSPTERDFEDHPGVILWRKQLEPGETWRIRHQYEVTYPRETSLVESPGDAPKVN